MEPWLLHPAAVHFPIALLLAGGAAAAARLRAGSAAWLEAAEAWMLLAGTLSAWGALALGLLAARGAPGAGAAWAAVESHSRLAWWSCAAFSTLLFLRLAAFGTGRRLPRQQGLEAGLWLIGLLLMFATASGGLELVYVFGVGVRPR